MEHSFVFLVALEALKLKVRLTRYLYLKIYRDIIRGLVYLKVKKVSLSPMTETATLGPSKS